MAFYEFKDEEGGTYGSFEVFYEPGQRVTQGFTPAFTPAAGWYWWARFPGCLPDGEASGPFKTEQEAREDAQGA